MPVIFGRDDVKYIKCSDEHGVILTPKGAALALGDGRPAAAVSAFALGTLLPAMGNIQAGTLKVIAVASPERVAALGVSYVPDDRTLVVMKVK